MHRINPFLSLTGFTFLAILLAGLGASYWLNGRLIFSPGALTGRARPGVKSGGYTSHSEFETQCELCHQPLQSIQANLCLDCHTNVEQQIISQHGAHGHIPSVDRCYACHLDHRGREFSPAQAAEPLFDHRMASFDLIHHQVQYSTAPMTCTDCHDPQSADYASRDETCTACHASHDMAFMQQHQQEFGGLRCLDCHDGKDRFAGFDHARSTFPLTGQHRELHCAQCHTVQGGGPQPGPVFETLFVNLPSDCQACHAEPAQHQGLFPATCKDCHSTGAWTPASLDGQPFDHTLTGFSLAHHQQGFDGSPLTCLSCHAAGIKTFEVGSCTTCHANQDQAFMNQHLAQFGPGCLNCHDGVDRMRNFDHNQFFLLDGRHAEIDCQSCHGSDLASAVYRGLPSACVDCHAEPAIHSGFFGVNCQDCHSTSAWTPAMLHQHAFPLDHGGQGQVACQTCHPSAYTEYTCYGCHEHQPEAITASHQEAGVKAEELPLCTQCHPAGLVTR